MGRKGKDGRGRKEGRARGGLLTLRLVSSAPQLRMPFFLWILSSFGLGSARADLQLLPVGVRRADLQLLPVGARSDRARYTSV